MAKARMRSQLGIAQEKEELLSKIKKLFDQKSRRLTIEIGDERFSAAECLSFTFDPDEAYDSFQFVRPTSRASFEFQDILYKAQEAGEDGNDITVTYEDGTEPAYATKIIQDLTYTAKAIGADGNDITITYVDDADAGSETVEVDGTDITVHLDATAITGSTATQVKAAIEAEEDADDLVGVTISGTASDVQTAQAETALLGGVTDGEGGGETVDVTGTDITVTMEDGVSTASQILAAINASEDAKALVYAELTGTGSEAQSADDCQLEGGGTTEYYDLADIIYIKRLRNKKYLVKLASDADPEQD